MGPPETPDKGACPLRCRLRRGAATGQVDWAGLPVNLDLAFSRRQAEKVYAQHLMRKRESQLWRLLHGDAPLCVCESAARDRDLGPDAA